MSRAAILLVPPNFQYHKSVIIGVDHLSACVHRKTMETDIARYPGGRNYTGFNLPNAFKNQKRK